MASRNLSIWMLIVLKCLIVSSTSIPKKPNIILVMTDDQDKELGSMQAMPKTLKILEEGGANFLNAFTNAPICCPSRSTFFTGLHVHNHNVWTNNDNCSGTDWIQQHEHNSFPTFLQGAGYKTGYFGKYLNNYDGEHVPPGWDYWLGQIKNAAFYNYKVRHNNRIVSHGRDYHKDYFTDLITNTSLSFIQQSKQRNPDQPLAVILSMPAPHGPEDAAPQYNRLFENVTWHRTPSWNYAPNPDKEYLLQITGKMEPIQVQFTDLLMRKRLMTLKSVDDAVERVFNAIRDLGELDNTYFIFTSDHGYHLGQFGMAKGKSLPYDFDTRIPLYMRGPNIRPGVKVSNLIGMVDFAPTLLDIAGVAAPEFMDGRSIMPLINDSNYHTDKVIKKQRWRDTYLIERGRMRPTFISSSFGLEFGLEDGETSEDIEEVEEVRDLNKELNVDCGDEKFLYPCTKEQKNYCTSDRLGKTRLRKCKNLEMECPCNSRRRRAKRAADEDEKDDSFVQKCSVRDGAVECERIEESESPKTWDDQKEALDQLIQDYRQQLASLKNLRKDIRLTFRNSIRSRSSAADGTSPADPRSSSLTPPLLLPRPDIPQEEMCLCGEDEGLEPMNTYADLSEMVQGDGLDDLPPKQRERLIRRLERIEKREKKKSKKNNDDEAYEECDQKDRICLRKQRISMKRNNPFCQVEGVECSVMNNDHWTTEPKWTLGPFCYCNNAQTNTYWCLRTINDTHNHAYCEYIDGYLSYYDINVDPYQLENKIFELSYDELTNFHNLLSRLRKCRGAKQCTYRYRD